MKFVPDAWRDYRPSFSSSETVASAAPDIGQKPGELPDFEDLRGNSALDSRRKANAVFVVLGQLVISGGLQRTLADCGAARNSDLWPFLESMKQVEDRFNHWAHYDYVFLNDEVSVLPCDPVPVDLTLC